MSKRLLREFIHEILSAPETAVTVCVDSGEDRVPTPTPGPADNARVSSTAFVLEKLLAMCPGDEFVRLALGHVRAGKRLSAKQRSVLIRMMQSCGMHSGVGEL